jgi:uncharacterized membrane protein
LNAIIVILSGLLQNVTITSLSPLPLFAHLIPVNLLGLFNGQVLFILKFFGEILLVFFIGGVVGKMLHLDRVTDADSDSDAHSHSHS